MALIATKTECLQLERLSLFNLDINRTMRLDDFEQLQTQHTIRTLQFLRECARGATPKRAPANEAAAAPSAPRARGRRGGASTWRAHRHASRPVR